MTLIRTPRLVATLASLAALGLAGCGGGDGEGPPAEPPVVVQPPPPAPPPPPAANRAPTALATAAGEARVGRRLALDGRASSDPDGDALSHRWTLLSAPAGSRAPLDAADSALASLVPDVAGAYEFQLAVGDGRAGEGRTTLRLQAAAPDFVVRTDAPEPLAGDATLSLNGPVEGRVQWFLRRNGEREWLGTGAADGAATLRWNAARVARTVFGPDVEARIELPGGRLLPVSRRIDLAEPPSGAIRLAATLSRADDAVVVDLVASSSAVEVVARLDGAELARLARPNHCAGVPCAAFDTWRFSVPDARIGAAGAVLRLALRDAVDREATLDVQLPAVRPPRLVIGSPVDGQFVFGSLPVRGQAVAADGTPVRLRWFIDDEPVAGPAAPSGLAAEPLGTLALDGVTAGRHRVTVEAEDAAGALSRVDLTLFVAASAAEAVPPSLVLPAGVGLAGWRGGRVLLLDRAAGARLQNLDGSGAVTLAGTPGLLATDPAWAGGALVGDGLLAGASLPDCPVASCLYQWGPDGRATNLSLRDTTTPRPPWAAAGLGGLAAVGDRFAVTLQPYDGGLVLVDTATGRLRFIERPAVPEANVLTRVALRVADGVPELLFSLAPSLTREPTLFRWRADSGTASVFSPGWQPVTDGRRLAWTRAPLAIASWNPGTLVTAPADGSQPAVEYPLHEIGNYVLADGVLAWQALGRERSLPGPVQVSVAHGDTPQAIDGSILLHVAGGWVYLTTGRAAIEAYDPATRTLRIVARERPDQWLVDGGVVLLRYGRAVLRVAD